MDHALPPCFRKSAGRDLISQICSEHDLDVELVIDALSVNDSHEGAGRRAGINEDFSEVIDAFLRRAEQRSMKTKREAE